MKDSYYTPIPLAKKLVDYIPPSNISIVADFCVGDGELLRAAQKRWPKIKCLATDISRDAILNVKKSHPDWFFGKCNFLKIKSRNSCIILKNNKKKVDLILLNPPFSCKGGTRLKSKIDNINYTSSIALTFLVESISYLSQLGSIYAILPESVAYSERDHLLWKKLVKDYNLSILYESSENHFRGCSPNILFVSINSKVPTNSFTYHKSIDHGIMNISLLRGKISMPDIHKHPQGNIPLIHTTNLQQNKLKNINYNITSDYSNLTGPAVLIPRVSVPRKDKIYTLKANQKICLSDCVIALKTETQQDSERLTMIILKNWNHFLNLYKGTGARYITLSKLKCFFALK